MYQRGGKGSGEPLSRQCPVYTRSGRRGTVEASRSATRPVRGPRRHGGPSPSGTSEGPSPSCGSACRGGLGGDSCSLPGVLPGPFPSTSVSPRVVPGPLRSTRVGLLVYGEGLGLSQVLTSTSPVSDGLYGGSSQGVFSSAVRYTHGRLTGTAVVSSVDTRKKNLIFGLRVPLDVSSGSGSLRVPTFFVNRGHTCVLWNPRNTCVCDWPLSLSAPGRPRPSRLSMTPYFSPTFAPP